MTPVRTYDQGTMQVHLLRSREDALAFAAERGLEVREPLAAITQADDLRLMRLWAVWEPVAR